MHHPIQRLFCVVALLLTVPLTATAYDLQAGFDPLPDLPALQLVSPAHTFALLVHPLQLEAEPNELDAKVQIRHIDGILGASWAPGIYLYWDVNDWIALKLAPNTYRVEGQARGKGFREQNFPFEPLDSEWVGLRLLWQRDHKHIDVYATHDMEGWTLLTSIERAGDGIPWIALGKGWASNQINNPFLANTYVDLGGDEGPVGVVHFRGIMVEADRQIVLEDNLAGKEVNASLWTTIVDGDPQTPDRLRTLESLYIEHVKK